MKNLIYLLNRFIIWLIITILWWLICIAPIINWIPILSHIMVWIYIIIWIMIIIWVWDAFLSELKKDTLYDNK